MSDNEYEGSGHFVGDSTETVSRPSAPKKAKISDRKIEKESAEIASEPDYAQVGQNTQTVSKNLGTPTPPIGEVASGVVDQATLFAKEHPVLTGGLLAGGLYGAWKALNSGQQEGSKWDRTVAGRPRDASLGNTPVVEPAAAVEAAPKPTGPVPAPTFPVAAQQQPAISGYGQQTMNAPTGVPAPVAPAAPAEPAAPVISPKDQAAIDLANAKREAVLADIRRKDELHAKNLAEKVKADEAKLQQNNGAAGRSGSKQEAEVKMVKSSIIAQEDKAADAALKAQNKKPVTGAVAPAPAPVETVVAATPEPGPAVVAEKPPEKAPKPKIALPEGWGKGMTWLVNQHGVEGAADFINRYNNGKPFTSHDEMMKSYLANTTRPKYSDIPKDVRKARGIVPPAQTMAPGMSGAAIPPRTSLGPQQDLTQGGGAVLHMLNPMKL